MTTNYIETFATPITRSITQPITAPITATGTGGASYTPASTFLTVAGAWFYGWDNTDLKVNSDGTGGSVADGGTVGRWNDRSGYGNHINQTTAALRPVHLTGKGVNFPWKITGGTNQTFLSNTSLTTTLHKAAISGGFVAWFPGSPYDGVIDYGAPSSSFLLINGGGNTAGAASCEFFKYFNGASFINTSKRFTSRYCTVAFRSNGTDTKFWINGELYTGAALSAVNLTTMYMARQSGGAQSPLRMLESVTFDAALSDADMANLNTYLRRQAGFAAPAGVNAVIVYGDSLTLGIGSETGVPWHFNITNRSTYDWYSYALDGGTLFSTPIITASRMATYKTSGETVAVLWIGTNDILSGSRTGAQLEAALNSFCTTLRAAGFKVVVCTLQDLTTNRAEKNTFNTLLKANWTGYADALADLDSVLNDNTNTTYFTSDTTHLLDAGYAEATSIIQTAMAGLA